MLDVVVVEGKNILDIGDFAEGDIGVAVGWDFVGNFQDTETFWMQIRSGRFYIKIGLICKLRKRTKRRETEKDGVNRYRAVEYGRLTKEGERIIT